ncbi:MAG: accessory factor UbiK family protein [Proteobacteria bacterium]|nr:accessory factor UbiK family protein [Pseudomonadota bacterium]
MNQNSSLKSAILSLLPPALADDLKESIDALIQGQFEQMNLVPRSESGIQQKVLTKTRAKLEALEQVLEDLDKQQK